MTPLPDLPALAWRVPCDVCERGLRDEARYSKNGKPIHVLCQSCLDEKIRLGRQGVRGQSALDGISMTAIDTDPDEGLRMTLGSLHATGCTVLSVVPMTFRIGHLGVERVGYLVVSFDPIAEDRQS